MFKQLLNQIVSKLSKKAAPTAKAKPIPKRQREQIQLRQLRENTIAQTPYTPAAKKEIRKIDLFQYGTPRTSSFANQSGGTASHMSVGINRGNMASRDSYPVQTMRHESLHALDDNLYKSTSVEGSFANSQNFFNLLQNVNKKRAGRLQRMLGGNPQLYNPKDKDTLDTEGFAYTGEDPRVMLAPQRISSQYKGIYTPQTKGINAIPMYPSPQTLEWIKRYTHQQ